ncbi:hypothetical protein E2C01_093247 [Portunus trituberculatus]|uniref:Uncharacterized protein n=1 Tax=Portunus trituberculatus TaxID=210409 RepID=A0A5B7K002_PORTR|nr:hypothetical protein [Portunus trituberculatus]
MGGLYHHGFTSNTNAPGKALRFE